MEQRAGGRAGGCDWVTSLAYLVVVSVCAPVWEEAIFRGFLLPSLARTLPPPGAALASALLFALCHFRLSTLAPLLLLGLVFGVVYQKSDNLAPPIMLHSLWNVYVLASMALRGGGAAFAAGGAVASAVGAAGGVAASTAIAALAPYVPGTAFGIAAAAVGIS